jgi:hypothetical protein
MRHQRAGCVALREIERIDARINAVFRADFLRDLSQLVLAACDKDDVIALRRDLPREFRTESARCACDECPIVFSFQFSVLSGQFSAIMKSILF